MARRRNSCAPSETAIQAAVLEHWLTLGLPNTLVAAIPNAFAHGQPGLTCGLADLLVLAPGIGVGFIELKKDGRSRPSDAQIVFGKLCAILHVRHTICYGRDEPIRVLEDWGVVKPARAAA
jgi:hypothetical protein